jgi:flagellar biosynthesis GTPase FlhF
MGEYIKKHKRGIIGTIIYHAIILILLIFLGFFTPLPLPGEEGILVNFGTTDNGSGIIEPSPARNNPAPSKPVQKEEKREVVPPPVQSQPKTTQPAPAKDVAMTQDYEKTVAVDAAEEKKRVEEKKRLEQLENEKQQQIAKDLEAERIRKQQEEAERLRKEEEARKAQEEQRKINEINSRVQSAFSSNNASGTGDEGNNNGRSQGTTFPGGNQGSPTGDPNAGNFGQGGSGSGNQGSGPSYSLSGRSAKNLPRPNYPGDDEGIVVVKITVDKYGKVTAAEPGVRGTTIMNERFWNEAKQAALKANFNSDDKAPAFQQGTITYRFILD